MARAEYCEVLATWQRLEVDRESDSGGWVDRHPGEAPERLRASLGASRLSVWLPSGVRVSCGLPRFTDPRASTYFHRYREAGTGTPLRIVFAIAKPEPLPPIPAGVHPFDHWATVAGL